MKNKKENRGGSRKNSGRKPSGRVEFRARVLPRQISTIKEFIKKLDAMTPAG